MTYNPNTNRNTRNNSKGKGKSTYNVVPPKLSVFVVKVQGVGKHEGNDTLMPAKFYLNQTQAVQEAIKAWRDEFNIPHNHDHRGVTRIFVREAKGLIGATAMTQKEMDKIEAARYEDVNGHDDPWFVGDDTADAEDVFV